MASTDPSFYAYLCAVADWRLKDPQKFIVPRPGIRIWQDFLAEFQVYWNVEPRWRKALIEGNVGYYSTGELPAGLPVLTGKLWDIVVSETVDGKHIISQVDKT